MNEKDTFYALSTPKGVSATATVKISGPSSPQIVSTITKKPLKYFKHGVSRLVNIYNINNTLIDRCLVVIYLAPRSYTGENLAEIHTHGNPTIVDSLFNCLSGSGLRLAKPGEFTRTAYLNNKIDLVQAEATLSLIKAQSVGGVDLSLNNLGGALSKEFISVRKNLIRSLSLVEYELDISDTDNLKQTQTTVKKQISISLNSVKNLIKSHKTSRILSDGVRIVLMGKPNVGKSTLFNALLKHSRSIVSHSPGTTRDTIEAGRNIAGYSATLVDTAGIRTTSDAVEHAGVDKALSELKSADLILSIVDTLPIKINFKKPKKTPHVLVYNKIDLITGGELEKLYKNKNIDVFISAKNKQGIKDLSVLIEKAIGLHRAPASGFFITSKRQVEVLLAIKKTLLVVLGLKPFDIELVALEIKNAINQFNWLLGETTPDDVLDEVFSFFCVGK